MKNTITLSTAEILLHHFSKQYGEDISIVKPFDRDVYQIVKNNEIIREVTTNEIHNGL